MDIDLIPEFDPDNQNWDDVPPLTSEQIKLLEGRIRMAELGIGVLSHEEAKRRLAKWLRPPPPRQAPI